MSKKIETDFKTFIKFWSVPLIIAAIMLFIVKAKTGLIIIGISVFMALALKPLVRIVNRFFIKHFGSDKEHQAVSVALAYLIVVLVIGTILAVVGPVVVNETSRFVQHFPETFETTLGGWDGVNDFGKTIGIDNLQGEIDNGINYLSSNLLGMLGSNLVSGVTGVADVVMKVVLILILTLLLLLEGPKMLSNFWKEAGADDKDGSDMVKVTRRITVKMGDVVSTYVSKQVLVAMIDGCASMAIVFVLSLILGFSPTLAIPMGLTTMAFYLIPMFGQFIGGTLVTVLLFFSNPLAALIFAIIYITYSQIENNIIAPKIQGDALNLKPLVILCAIVIGMYMFGLLGAIIAIPIAGCIRVIVEEYPNIKAARE